MQFGTIDGERHAHLTIEVDDQDSFEDIQKRWQLRFDEEGIQVSEADLSALARRTYEHYFDAQGQVRPRSVETR